LVIFHSGNDPFIHQLLHAGKIHTREIALRLKRRQLGPFLPGVELDEHVSGAHRLARIEVDSCDATGKVGTDRDTMDGLHGADYAHRRRPLLPPCHNTGNGFRRWLKCGAVHRRLHLPEFHEAEAAEEHQHQAQHQEHSFRHDSP